MAERSRSKARSKTKKKRERKPDLTMAEMLSRIPDSDFLTTKQVQHVFNDCHEVSVYRYVQQDFLTPHEQWGKRGNTYPRSEVVALVRRKFTPVPKSEKSESDTNASDSNQAKKKARPRTRKKKGRRVRKKDSD